MKRELVAAAILASLIVSSAASLPVLAQSDTSAGPPVPNSQANPNSKILGDNHGFVLVSEKPTGHGSVIDTYQSSTTTIRTIGWSQDQLTFDPVPAADGHAAGLAVGVASSGPKTGPDADRYRKSGRTPLTDLMDLGVSKADAQRELSQGLIQDGPVAMAGGRGVDGRNYLADIINAPAVYDYKCFDINQLSGEFTGRGCTVIYRPVAYSNGDWWLESHYYVSVQLSAQTMGCDPIDCYFHFQGLAWKVVWAKGNAVVDWSPKASQPYDTCHPIDWSVGWQTDKGVKLGIAGKMDVCPNTAGLWVLNSTTSGSGWWGNDKSRNWHSAEGAQIIHSPPSASYSYKSYYLIWYCNGMWPFC
jgi:hypothetical protein